jgi:hypothetical protein
MNLPLITFEEDGSHIVYCPPLDLSGYGDTEEEAIRSFHVTLDEFFKYTTNKGTLWKELERLGWKKGGTKRSPLLTLPDWDKLLRDNEPLQEIVREHSYQKIEEKVEIPFPALM